MIAVPLQKALSHEVEGLMVDGVVQRYSLYLIRDEDVVLYIGQAENALYRLSKHLMTFEGWPSVLGKFILANKPESMQWTYELRKPEECFEYVKEYYTATYGNLPDILRILLGRFPIKPDVDDAEIALIRHFRPCLNSAMNLNPTPLPDKYRA